VLKRPCAKFEPAAPQEDDSPEESQLRTGLPMPSKQDVNPWEETTSSPRSHALNLSRLDSQPIRQIVSGWLVQVVAVVNKVVTDHGEWVSVEDPNAPEDFVENYGMFFSDYFGPTSEDDMSGHSWCTKTRATAATGALLFVAQAIVSLFTGLSSAAVSSEAQVIIVTGIVFLKASWIILLKPLITPYSQVLEMASATLEVLTALFGLILLADPSADLEMPILICALATIFLQLVVQWVGMFKSATELYAAMKEHAKTISTKTKQVLLGQCREPDTLSFKSSPRCPDEATFHFSSISVSYSGVSSVHL